MDKATIQLIHSLSQKRNRDEQRLFVVEGDKLIEELVRSKLIVRKIFHTNAVDFNVAKIPVEQVSEATMQRLSSFKTASKILALVEKPAEQKLPAADEKELFLALDNVQDPGNLGTIIRIANWFGIRHIICSPDTADCYNPKVVQATMGAIFRINVHYTELSDYLQQVKKTVPVYGTFLDGENIYQKELSTGGIIVMGNEGNGISSSVAAGVSERLFIPAFPEGNTNAESLNVAVSTAIICAEFRRRAYSM